MLLRLSPHSSFVIIQKKLLHRQYKKLWSFWRMNLSSDFIIWHTPPVQWLETMKLVKRKEFEEFIHDRMIIDHPAYHPRNEPRFFYLLSKVPLWVDFKGKTIIPFNTHEGSGQSGTVEDIREEVKGASVDDSLHGMNEFRCSSCWLLCEDQPIWHGNICFQRNRNKMGVDILVYRPGNQDIGIHFAHEAIPQPGILWLWDASPDIDLNWKKVKEIPACIGDYTWTAWDYLGEAGIGIVSYSGVSLMKSIESSLYNRVWCDTHEITWLFSNVPGLMI